MNLRIIPHAFAILFSAAAFAVVWLAGLASDVPLHAIALRAVIGAAAFWAAGLVAGKVFVRGVYQAVAEHMAAKRGKSGG